MDPIQDHPITELVHNLLDAVQAVVAADETPAGPQRSAEFCYELDQVVSDYLDTHQLSAEQFESIQQQVINSIAHQFAEEDPEHLSASLDEHGNAALSDVLVLLDQHVVADDHHHGHISAHPPFLMEPDHSPGDP